MEESPQNSPKLDILIIKENNNIQLVLGRKPSKFAKIERELKLEDELNVLRLKVFISLDS